MDGQKKIPNDLVMRVLKMISDRTIDNPIIGDAIADQLGTNWRTVANCVEILRYIGFKIGSSKTKPMGYFLARTREEMRPTAERTKQSCLKQLKQVQRMYQWDGEEPTLFDGRDLAEVDDAIQEFVNATGITLDEFFRESKTEMPQSMQ